GVSVRGAARGRRDVRAAITRDDDALRRHHLTLQLVHDVVGIVVNLLDRDSTLGRIRLSVDAPRPRIVLAVEVAPVSGSDQTVFPIDAIAREMERGGRYRIRGRKALWHEARRIV